MPNDNREQRAHEWIRRLTEFTPRFAGTPSERAAAEAVGDWMRGLGARSLELTPAAAAPKTGYVLALHAALATFAVWGDGFFAAVAGVLAAASFWSEFKRQRPLLSRLLAAAPTVNVVGRFGSATPTRRIVLSAHIDAAQAGVLFSQRLADAFAQVSNRLKEGRGTPAGPLDLPEMLVSVAAATAVADWLGAGGFLFGLLQFALFLGLLVTTGLGLQWAMAAPTPGANDNASAVAAMLTAVESITARLPDDVEVWAIGTGAEEVGSKGMHGFVHAMPGWSRDNTFFVNFECVGGGTLHIIRSEGIARKFFYPTDLTDLARRIAADGRYGAVSMTDLLAGTDGHVAAEHGYPSLSLISLEPNGVPRNYHRLEDTVEHIDCGMVIRAADLGAETALQALAGATQRV